MRVRLRLEVLEGLLARSAISQNHWAMRLGLSKGHLSNLLAGKHLYPSARTRERMLEVLGVSFETLFEVEPGHDLPDYPVQAALRSRYVIDRTVGHGGMGVVYLARDLRFGRSVAIKVVNEEVVSGVGADALLKEIIHGSRLQHHHVLPLLDAGDAEGAPYYVLPYLRDGSLRDLLRARRTLPIGRALTIASGIAAALDHAHGLGVLHCDVKPANVLLSDDHAYLIDFGIARVVQGEVWSGESRAEFDSGAGTPAYVSPEQARGEPVLDRRADVYSLACLLFEMLTGRPPFEGDTTLATVAKRFIEPPPDLRRLAPHLPAELADAIRRGLALDRDDRTPTAGALLADCRLAVATAGSVVGLGPDLLATPSRPSLLRRMALVTQQTRFAWRGLVRAPGVALAVMLTLGLGIGVNSVVFQVVDRLFLRAPEGVYAPEALRRVFIGSTFLGRHRISASASYAVLGDVRGAAGVAGAAAYFTSQMSLGRGPAAQPATVQLATHDLFTVLGPSPAVGRFFGAAEDAPGTGGTAVLGWAYWRGRFGGDPAVLGRVVELEGRPFTVIGVAPEGFTGVDPERVDVFLPLHNAADLRIGGPWATSRGIHWTRIVARLAPGATDHPAGEAATMRLRAADVGRQGADPEARVIMAPLLAARGPLASNDARVSLWVGGVSLVLLLITCANVVNLLLTRLTHREGEFAIWAALGAGRSRLVGAILGETLLLAAFAAVAGLLVAQLAGSLLWGLFLPDAVPVSPLTDGRVIAFTLVAALSLGLLAGAVPAWRASRADAGQALRAGRGAVGPARSLLRTGLLVGQAALSVTLLVGAGLFLRSFAAVRGLDAGVDMDHVAVVQMPFDRATFPPARARAVQREGMVRVAAMPGVVGVTGSNSAPMMTSWAELLRVPGLDSLPTSAAGGPYINIVGDGYFDVVGTAIAAGRGFTEADRAGAPPVAIVGAAMARLYWGEESPIGRCLMIGSAPAGCTEIVGVAADAPRASLLDRTATQYYVPAAQYAPESVHDVLFVRSTAGAATMAERIRATLQGLAPDLPLVRVTPLWEVAAPETRAWTLGSTLFGILGALALLVAALGLYGVLAFDVARRSREIGIRAALGATPRMVLTLVLRSGLYRVGGGLLLGLALAALVAGRLGPLLFRTDPHDPLIYLGVALVLLSAGVVACLLPAFRAARVAPMEALRAE